MTHSLHCALSTYPPPPPPYSCAVMFSTISWCIVKLSFWCNFIPPFFPPLPPHYISHLPRPHYLPPPHYPPCRIYYLHQIYGSKHLFTSPDMRIYWLHPCTPLHPRTPTCVIYYVTTSLRMRRLLRCCVR